MVKLRPDYSALDRPAIVTYDLWRRRLGTWARESSQELCHTTLACMHYTYTNATRTLNIWSMMSELEEEVLIDLEFEVDEHSSTTSDSGTDSEDDDDGGVGEMEKMRKIRRRRRRCWCKSSDSISARAGWAASCCSAPRPGPGPAQLAIDLSCTLIVTGWLGETFSNLSGCVGLFSKFHG